MTLAVCLRIGLTTAKLPAMALRRSLPSTVQAGSGGDPSTGHYEIKSDIFVAKEEAHADELAKLLIDACRDGVGMDCEWPVDFQKGAPQQRIALVQVSGYPRNNTRPITALFHLSCIGRFPARLKELLEDCSIPKSGVNIHNDAKKARGPASLSILPSRLNAPPDPTPNQSRASK